MKVTVKLIGPFIYQAGFSEKELDVRVGPARRRSPVRGRGVRARRAKPVTVRDPATGTRDIWIYEIARNLRTRLTSDAADDNFPVWAPDGRTVYFASNRGNAAVRSIYRVEVGGTAGWTTSDGVTGGPVIVPGFGSFDEAGPKDAFSWGLRLGVMVTPNIEVGALFNQQKTQLELLGTSTVELGDQSVNNYHGYVAYNFGDEDASVRPYFLGGLGRMPSGWQNG